MDKHDTSGANEKRTRGFPAFTCRLCVCVCSAFHSDCKKILERQSEREREENRRRGGGGEMCDGGGRGDDSEGDGESERRRRGGLIKKEEMDGGVG